MAITAVVAPGRGSTALAAAAAPTTSEVVTNVTWGTILEVNIGATATTVTVVRPGTHVAGDNVADYVIGPLTSQSIAIRLWDFRDPATGSATVNFTQVTGVTARRWNT